MRKLIPLVSNEYRVDVTKAPHRKNAYFFQKYIIGTSNMC
jgi:hypothetical protein